MKGKLVLLVLGLAIVGMLTPFAAADEAPRMTKEQLKALLDNPDVVILDVRTSRDWKGSEKKIKGAVRENPKRFKSGLINIPKTRPSFSIAPDPVRAPVPVWHGNS